MVIESSAPLATVVQNADKDLLLELLNKASVSVGHLSGRLISVPGYEGQITFSKFQSRVEDLYQEIAKEMQDRQQIYQMNSQSGIDPFPMKGRFSMIPNVALLPFTLPAKIVSDTVAWASTPYPEVSEEEENDIDSTLQWRKKIDDRFNALVESSQAEIEKRAASSFTWSVIKSWDSFLDTKNVTKNIHQDDDKILQSMVTTRKKRENLKPSKETKDAFADAAAFAVVSYLVYAKYQKPEEPA